MTKFLIDSNSLIDAKDFFYSFDICPGFWQSIKSHYTAGVVFSIDEVKAELVVGNDKLVRWAKWMPSSFFQTSKTQAVAAQYGAVIDWVKANYAKQHAVSSFAAKADGWLIAYAKVHGYVLVTQEKLNPVMKKRVPNPNVCQHFNVKYCNVFEMLRTIGIKFGMRK